MAQQYNSICPFISAGDGRTKKLLVQHLLRRVSYATSSRGGIDCSIINVAGSIEIHCPWINYSRFHSVPPEFVNWILFNYLTSLPQSRSINIQCREIRLQPLVIRKIMLRLRRRFGIARKGKWFIISSLLLCYFVCLIRVRQWVRIPPLINQP